MTPTTIRAPDAIRAFLVKRAYFILPHVGLSEEDFAGVKDRTRQLTEGEAERISVFMDGYFAAKA